MLDDSRHLHAEYQTVGGQRLVADGMVQRGVISAVRIGGDFPLELDDALNAVSSALSNAATESDDAQLGEAVRRTLQMKPRDSVISREIVSTAAWQDAGRP